MPESVPLDAQAPLPATTDPEDRETESSIVATPDPPHSEPPQPEPPQPEPAQPEPAPNKWLPRASGDHPIATTPTTPQAGGTASKWLAPGVAQRAPDPLLAQPPAAEAPPVAQAPLAAEAPPVAKAPDPVEDVPDSVEEAPDPVEDVPDPVASPRPSLAELIRAGDCDAATGFYEAHAYKVRSYCAEACRWELVEEACEASFVDFVGRMRAGSERDVDLEDILLKATRGAAAGRAVVEQAGPAGAGALRGRGVDKAICAVMPELLAADANGEGSRGNQELHAHIENCPTCQVTAAGMKRAERAFTQAPGWWAIDDPEREPTPEAIDDPAREPAPEAEPAIETGARAEVPQREPEVVRVRVCRGGLLGAAKRRLRSRGN